VNNIIKYVEVFFAVDIEFLSFEEGQKRKYTVQEINEIHMFKCAFVTTNESDNVLEIQLTDQCHYSRDTDNIAQKLSEFHHLVTGNRKGHCFFYANNRVDELYLKVLDELSMEKNQETIFDMLQFHDGYKQVAKHFLSTKIDNEEGKVYLPDLTLKTIGIHFSKDGNGSITLPFGIFPRPAPYTSKCTGDVYGLVLLLGLAKWALAPKKEEVGRKRNRG
jgi:hypothetical protein